MTQQYKSYFKTWIVRTLDLVGELTATKDKREQSSASSVVCYYQPTHTIQNGTKQ